MNILFVCTGNTCRSPMAEYLMRKELGDKAQISSAGLCVAGGASASSESVEVMGEYGIDLSGFLSRPVTEEAIMAADYVFTMTREHRRILTEHLPEYTNKIQTLKENGDIRDPYMQGTEVYRATRDEIAFWVKRRKEQLVELTAMREEHIAWAAELNQACFSDPWSEEMIADELENPLACYLVAEQNGQAVGYGGFYRVMDEGNITNIAVDKDFRQKGIGSRLLQGLIRCAKEQKISFFTLEVRVSNQAAIRLYASHGFQPVGLRKGYYADNQEDALLMTLYFEKGSETDETAGD